MNPQSYYILQSFAVLCSSVPWRFRFNFPYRKLHNKAQIWCLKKLFQTSDLLKEWLFLNFLLSICFQKLFLKADMNCHVYKSRSGLSDNLLLFPEQAGRRWTVQRCFGLSVLVKAWLLYLYMRFHQEWGSVDPKICSSFYRSAPLLELPHGLLYWKCFSFSLPLTFSPLLFLSVLIYYAICTFSLFLLLTLPFVTCLFVACGVFSQNYHQTVKRRCRRIEISFNMLSKTAAHETANLVLLLIYLPPTCIQT